MFGYDHPLNEYFFAKEDDSEDSGFEFSVASHMTLIPHPDYPNKLNWSNGDLLELIDKELGKEAPDILTSSIALDLPF